MPVTYQIDPEIGLIRSRCVGDVRFLEVVDHFRELRRDPSLPPRLDVLLDLTELESVPETDQLGSVAREIASMLPKVEWGACAVVAASDLLFGMSRVFQAFAEPHFRKINVVRSVDEAEQWLASQRLLEG